MLMDLFEGRARVIGLAGHVDGRGTLVPFEFAEMPFIPCRAFVVHGVPSGATRGGHAHVRARQFLFRLSGRIVVQLRCDDREACVDMVSSDRGLLIGPEVWARQTYHGHDARLLVFVDQPYDPGTYTGGRP